MAHYNYLDKVGFVGTGKHDPRMDRVVSESILEYKARHKKTSEDQKTVSQKKEK